MFSNCVKNIPYYFVKWVWVLMLIYIYASFGTLCLLYAAGHFFGVVSLMMPALRNPDSDLRLTLEQESWIPSTVMLMSTPSHFTAGILSDIYGRKIILCFCMLPLVISSVLMYFATNFSMLLVAAIIVGTAGAGVAVGQVYIAEVVSPKRRGALIASNIALMALGLCMTLALGKFVHWRILIIFNAVPGIIGLVTSITSPDSPTWFASKGRFEECRTAFVWLRGTDDTDELRHLMEKQKEVEAARSNKNNKGQLMQNVKILFEKGFMKSTLICFASIMCVEASGKPVYISYALDFMMSVTGDKEHANYYALGAVVGDFIASSLSCVVLRVMKRRTVLFTTGFLALFCLMCFCTLSYFRSRNLIDGVYSWAVLICFLLYFFFINIGVLPVATAIQREIYPVFHRGLGLMVSGIINGVLLFTLVKMFPTCLKSYGIHGTFLLNGLLMLLALSYLFNFLPETGNRTLQDIECELKEEKLSLHKEQDIKLKMVYVPCHPNARDSFSL